MCFGRGEMRVAEGRRPEKHEEHDDAEGPQVDLRAREESRQRSPRGRPGSDHLCGGRRPANLATVRRLAGVPPSCARTAAAPRAPQNPACRMANTPRESAPERRALLSTNRSRYWDGRAAIASVTHVLARGG